LCVDVIISLKFGSEHGLLDSVANLVGDLVLESVGSYGEKAFLKLLFNFTAHVVLPGVELLLDVLFRVLLAGFESLGLFFILGRVGF
jgi:hypothetical protein